MTRINKYNNISEKLTIVTTTSYNLDLDNDRVRSKLCLKFLESAYSKGYEVILVDNNSPDKLLKDFRRFSQVLNQESETMGESRRQAIRYAFNRGKEIILWTEPEKYPLVPFIPEIIKPILERKSDLVMPKRKSLDSYPYMQQLSESFANCFWKNLTDTNIDIFFGPKAWKIQKSNYFLDYKGEYGDKWDSIVAPVINFISDKCKIGVVEVDYRHPRIQTDSESEDIEMQKKRINQLKHFIDYSEDYWKKSNRLN